MPSMKLIGQETIAKVQLRIKTRVILWVLSWKKNKNNNNKKQEKKEQKQELFHSLQNS